MRQFSTSIILLFVLGKQKWFRLSASGPDEKLRGPVVIRNKV